MDTPLILHTDFQLCYRLPHIHLDIGGLSSTLAFLTMKGTGYLQPEFKQSCFACQVDITRESLGLAKFLQNLTLESEPKKDHFILTAMLA